MYKDIKGYEGKYQINEEGIVKSLKKPIKTPTNTIGYRKEQFMKHTMCWNGYIGIKLGTKKYFLHRLLAETFIPNPYNKPFVNHKDANKFNNNLNNLEWCDNAYNIKHAYDNGLVEKRKYLNLKVKDSNNNIFENLYKASEYYKTTYKNILRALKKERKSYSGIYFEWIE